MATSIHSIRRTIAMIAALLLLAGGSTAVAANIRPVGLSEQAYRALMIRGEALNQLYGLSRAAVPSRADMIRAAALDRRYGNVWTRVSPAEFRTLVSAFGADVTTTLSPQQARAELARGQGLNRLAERYTATTKPVSAGPADGFDWGAAGIGFGAAFGAMFLAAAGALVLRKRARLVFHS